MGAHLYEPVPSPLAVLLRARMAALEWAEVKTLGPYLLEWAKPVVGEYFATLNVTGALTFHSVPTLTSDVGIGHESAARLRPRLTAGLELKLMSLHDQPWRTWELVEPEDKQAQATFVDAVAQLGEFAVRRTEELSVPGALEASLAFLEEDDDIELVDLPLYLAATGRVQEALALVNERWGADGLWRPHDERCEWRFAHQLRRWVALGAPPPPPLEAWPPGAFEVRPIEFPDRGDRARRREQQRAGSAALAAVRAALAHRRMVHTGKETHSLGNADEVDWAADALLAELAVRGVSMTRGRALWLSQGLVLTGMPFGWLRTRVWALRQMREGLHSLVEVAHAIRAALARAEPDHEAREDALEYLIDEAEAGPWPDNAFFYDDNDDENAWVEVRLDSEASDALRLMATDTAGKVREFTRREVWLRPNPTDPDAAIEVGTGGDSVVGCLDPGTTGHVAFATALRAAAVFDELVVAPGELRWVERPGGRALALRPPRNRWEPPAGMR